MYAWSSLLKNFYMILLDYECCILYICPEEMISSEGKGTQKYAKLVHVCTPMTGWVDGKYPLPNAKLRLCKKKSYTDLDKPEVQTRGNQHSNEQNTSYTQLTSLLLQVFITDRRDLPWCSSRKRSQHKHCKCFVRSDLGVLLVFEETCTNHGERTDTPFISSNLIG